jgi:hypothetical protein
MYEAQELKWFPGVYWGKTLPNTLRIDAHVEGQWICFRNILEQNRLNSYLKECYEESP